LNSLFFSLQKQMIGKMQTNREFVPHQPTKGAAAEQNWLAMLNTYLPERYKADSAVRGRSPGTVEPSDRRGDLRSAVLARGS
jgi:hypothetical protein